MSVSSVGSDVVRMVDVEDEVVVTSSKSVRVVVRGGNDTTPGPDGGSIKVAVKTVLVAGIAFGLPLHIPKARVITSSILVSVESHQSLASSIHTTGLLEGAELDSFLSC